MPKFQDEVRIQQGVPAAPAAGETALFADPTTGNINQRKSDGSSLDLTAAGSGGGGPSLPEAFDYVTLQVVKNAGAATVTPIGIVAPTLTATVATADDATGRWLRHTTGTTAGAASGVISAAYTLFQRGWTVAGHFRVKTHTDLLVQRNWVGFFSALPDASATPAAHIAAFRFDTVADGTAIWRCVTAAGTATQTVTPSGVAFTADTSYALRIEMTPTDVKFYINNVLVATHTTNLPVATQPLGWGIRVTALAALAAKTIRWGRVAFVDS